MRRLPLRGVAAALFALTLGTAGRGRAEPITLDQALRRAAEQQPEIAVARTGVELARGELESVQPWLPNPDLELAAGPLWAGGTLQPAVEVAIGQPLPWLGKRGAQVDAAQQRTELAQAQLEWTQREVAAAIRRAFWLALVERAHQQAATEAEQIGQELLAVANKRLELGSGTQLDVNVARAAAGRAHAERLASERHYREACAGLATAVNGSADQQLTPDGELPVLTLIDDDGARALAALEQRPDLRALRHAMDAASDDVQAADLAAIPDPTLRGSYRHEGDENALLVGLAVPLPVWNQARGERATTRAGRERARVEYDRAWRSAQRDLRSARQDYAAAIDAVQSFDRDVIGNLHDNLELARSAFQAGKIGLTEYNVMRRDLLDTRAAYLDSQRELVEARHRLERVLGRSLEQQP